MKKFKLIIGFTMFLIGTFIALTCVGIMLTHQIRNPDMTRMRLLIEYKDTVLTGSLGSITGYIGCVILSKD